MHTKEEHIQRPTNVAVSPLQQKKEPGCMKDDCRGLRTQILTTSLGNDYAAEVPPVAYDVLRSAGLPLDKATRASMESHFGRDFSRVRVHADAEAAASADEVQAHAYAVGEDIVFGRGNYAPATRAGQQLLAHELAHVVQQEGTTFGSSPVLQRAPKVRGTVEEKEEPVGRKITRAEMKTLQPGLDLARKIVARTVSRMQRVVHVLMVSDPRMVAPDDKAAADLFIAHFKSSSHSDAMMITDTFTAMLKKLNDMKEGSFRVVTDDDIELRKEGTVAYALRPDTICIAESVFSGRVATEIPAGVTPKGSKVAVGEGSIAMEAGAPLIAEMLIHETAHLTGACHSGGVFGFGFAGPPHPVKNFHQASFNAYVYNRFAFSLGGDVK